MKNWKTTVIGILGVIVAVSTAAISFLQGEFSGQSITIIMTSLAAVIPSIGNILSKDADAKD